MSKITALQNLLGKDPEDAMTRYMLAIELSKEGQFAEAANEIEEYLKKVEDEGAAYRILADAYLKIGKKKEAEWALRHGAEAARTHHHDGMAEEFEEKLKEL